MKNIIKEYRKKEYGERLEILKDFLFDFLSVHEGLQVFFSNSIDRKTLIFNKYDLQVYYSSYGYVDIIGLKDFSDKIYIEEFLETLKNIKIMY